MTPVTDSLTGRSPSTARENCATARSVVCSGIPLFVADDRIVDVLSRAVAAEIASVKTAAQATSPEGRRQHGLRHTFGEYNLDGDPGVRHMVVEGDLNANSLPRSSSICASGRPAAPPDGRCRLGPRAPL